MAPSKTKTATQRYTPYGAEIKERQLSNGKARLLAQSRKVREEQR